MGPVEALLRIGLHPLLATACRVLFGLRLTGTRHLPSSGPAIIVSNHQGYLDPVFVQMAVTRPVRFMMTSDFYDVGFARPFFRLVGAIRVDQTGPKREALRQALEVLRKGGLVGIFPEGRLSVTGAIGEVLPGVAFLSAKGEAPVVPARIDGSIRVLPKGRWLPRHATVRVGFGPPFRFEDARDRDVGGRLNAAWGRI